MTMLSEPFLRASPCAGFCTAHGPDFILMTILGLVTDNKTKAQAALMTPSQGSRHRSPGLTPKPVDRQGHGLGWSNNSDDSGDGAPSVPPDAARRANPFLHQTEAFQNLHMTIYPDMFFEHLALGEARKTRGAGSDGEGLGEQ